MINEHFYLEISKRPDLKILIRNYETNKGNNFALLGMFPAFLPKCARPRPKNYF